MSDFGDDDDFDEEFLALTLKPPRLEATQQAQDTQINNNTDINANTNANTNSDAELQAAKGEVAILRSKLLEIERTARLERDQLVAGNQNAAMAHEAKMAALESTVRRLEDERKFLSVEVKNLGSRKRRKTDHAEDGGHVSQPPPEGPTIPTTTANSTLSGVGAVTQAPVGDDGNAPIRFVAHLVDDNAAFIDNLSRHSIGGMKHTTMEYLDKIVLTHEFSFDSFTIPSDEPISTHLVRFLNGYKNVLRLDQLITVFSQLLIQIIRSILETDNDRLYLPVPFLISLLQNCVIFRPSAVTKELTVSIISFGLELMNKFDSLLKPKEVLGELYERHEKVKIKVVQLDLLQKLSFQFSLEVIEVLLVNLQQYEDVEFNHKVVSKFESKLSALIKLIFSTNSCVNLIFVIVNIINCLLNSYENDVTKLVLLNQVTLDNLLKIIQNGIPIKKGWLITGINKIIGNDQDNALIPKLIDWNLKSNKYPQVVYPIENYDEFDILNKNEFQLTNLNFQILSILEKLILFFNINSNKQSKELHIKDSSFLKSIVVSIAKQQQLNILRPKSNLSHLRSKFISKLIRILNIYWESTIFFNNNPTNEEQYDARRPQHNQMDEDIVMTPLLPKEITQMLMITLSRIAFSNNETSQDSIEFLFKIRSNNNLKRTPIFNKFTEAKAREISHINSNDNEVTLEQLINNEVGLSNGVEFAYDDDVVELARDMLEKFTTMNEADSLFSAMNADG
jgi:hypothetical protein